MTRRSRATPCACGLAISPGALDADEGSACLTLGGVGVVWEIEIDERVVAIVSEDEDTSGIAPVVCDADGDGLADVREALHRTLGWRVYMAWKQTHSTGTTVERSHDPTRVTQLFNAR